MTTNLTFHMSSGFLQEVTGSLTGTGGTGTQNGSWAYLWNETPPSDVAASGLLPGAANNWTPLVLNGSISSNVTFNSTNSDYEVTVALTDASLGTVSSSSIYLIVQSENPAAHTDLTQSSAIGSTIGQILPNTQNWNYGYAAFEVTLTNGSADLGDLTAIPGFAWNTAVNIDYDDSTSQHRGLGTSAQSLTNTLSTNNPSAVLKYPTSGGTPYSALDGVTSMVNSPSNSTFGPGDYPTSAWSSYLTAVEGMSNITLSGTTNGEPDANGVWHNAQYYSYTVSTQTLASGAWGAAGTYFVFSPNASSQTQGYVVMSEATLQSNLYAAGQGTMSIWEDSAFTQAYDVPGSAPFGQPQTNVIGTSVNNQWGNLLTPFFTGFTAGYWGTTSQSANTMMPTTSAATNLGGGTIDLNQTLNWSPAYAFDVHRVGTIPTYQHNDFWTQQFFNNSNIYGSAFSDNLSVGLTTGPLIPLSQPDGSKLNVSNIDLYVYGASETATTYFTPVASSVYLSLPGGQSDYLPVTTVSATTTGPQLIVSGQTAGLFPESTLSVQLGLYQGNGQFSYATLQPASNSNTGQTDYWQNYNLTNNGGVWTATSGGSNDEGTFIITTLPMSTTGTTGQVYWYQLVFTDSGGPPKVYNFYATQGSSVGTIDIDATDFAADGGATLAPTGQANYMKLSLNPATSMPVGMLDFAYNSQFSAMPAAPVAGTLSGSTFTPFDGQDSIGITGNKYATGSETAAPDITIDVGSSLAFGWTGTNNDSSTNYNPSTKVFGWTSAYTNKIVANDIAMVTIYDGATAIAHLQAEADLDGQWTTSADTQQLGNGTYTVAMQEYLPGGTTIFGTGTSAVAPISAVLTLNVSLTQLTLQETSSGDALQFAPHGDLRDGAGNWLHFDPVAGTQLPQGAQLLLYATTADGTLVGRDGTIGGGVSLADATLARLGSMRSDGGMELLKLGQTLFLPDDQQLHFALLNPDGTITSRPDVHITPQNNGSMLVTGAGLSFSVTVGNNLDHQDYFASEQRSSNLPVVYLTQGESIHVEAAGSAKNANTIHFVRFDYDHDSDTIVGVGGVAYGNTDAFRAAVQANWDPSFAVQNGNGTFHVSQDWKVGGKQGFYAPVLVTPDGEIFVPGTANKDGRVHVQTFGENVFAFEDVRADHGGDFDYNDMVVKLSVL
ncbi:hypothetical protein SAMN02990966_01236 [Rhodospirillales bacterium URHD0017]|nr:hypothetical protein SAMN02990966_01236 [Rhodospirillales bacterium URHD0017]